MMLAWESLRGRAITSTSQRVTRGFHRLGVVLAGLTMLVGIAGTIFVGSMKAGDASVKHQQLVCARDKLNARSLALKDAADRWWEKDPLADTQDLKQLGCTTWAQSVSTQSALDARDDFTWLRDFSAPRCSFFFPSRLPPLLPFMDLSVR
jgi:hypothetical protein